MDPFPQVYQDAKERLGNLRNMLTPFQPTQQTPEERRQDFNNILEELEETIGDMKSSIKISGVRPEEFGLDANEILSRKRIVGDLENEMNKTVSLFNNSNSTNSTDVRNRISTDGGPDEPDYDNYNEFAQQQMLQEQDGHLDQVYSTVQNLRQQAFEMNDELEEQAVLVDDLGRDMDRVQDKLGRGVKRVETVLRKNQDTLGSCCIALLIIALCVLLVLLLLV